jgi:hypothetical protein
VRAECQCGACSFSVSDATGDVIRCHCVRCRRYHASAFGAFLRLSVGVADLGTLEALARYPDTCSVLGRCERLFCTRCRSKLATVALVPSDSPTEGGGDGGGRDDGGGRGGGGGMVLLALGSVVDDSLPAPLALKWQTVFEEWAVAERATWWSAQPPLRQVRLLAAAPTPRLLRGGCACGDCTFEALSGSEFQTQHCYCALCRRCSGSVCQTWVHTIACPSRSISLRPFTRPRSLPPRCHCKPTPLLPRQVPVRPDGFKWIAAASLKLVRTTPHGQRHMCGQCGCVLTIVYDSQPDCIWPVSRLCAPRLHTYGAWTHAPSARSAKPRRHAGP